MAICLIIAVALPALSMAITEQYQYARIPAGRTVYAEMSTSKELGVLVRDLYACYCKDNIKEDGSRPWAAVFYLVEGNAEFQRAFIPLQNMEPLSDEEMASVKKDLELRSVIRLSGDIDYPLDYACLTDPTPRTKVESKEQVALSDKPQATAQATEPPVSAKDLFEKNTALMSENVKIVEIDPEEERAGNAEGENVQETPDDPKPDEVITPMLSDAVSSEQDQSMPEEKADDNIPPQGSEQEEIQSSLVQEASSICIRALDAENGSGIAGVKFEIEHESKDKNPVIVETNAEGVAMLEDVPLGTYLIRVNHMPDDMEEMSTSVQVLLRDPGTCYDADFSTLDNGTGLACQRKRGSLELIVTDSETDAPIAGVLFSITGEDEAIRQATTDMNGRVVVNDLSVGNYIVQQKQWKQKYQEELEKPKQHKVQINHKEQTTLHILNTPIMGSITIETVGDARTEGRGDATLTGAVFAIMAEDDIRDTQRNIVFEKGSVVAEATVKDETGCTVVEKLWPGKYTVKQTSPSCGYYIAEDIESVELDTDNLKAHLVIREQLRTGGVSIQEYAIDKEGNKVPQAGTRYEVFLKKYEKFENAPAGDKYDFVIDDSGEKHLSGLAYGTYILEQTDEKGAPITASIREFTITGDEKKEQQFVYTRQKALYRIVVRAIDKVTQEPIKGYAEFSVEGLDGVFERVCPTPVSYGEYNIRSVTPPEGYEAVNTISSYTVGNRRARQGTESEWQVDIPFTVQTARMEIEVKMQKLTGWRQTNGEKDMCMTRPQYDWVDGDSIAVNIIAQEDIVAGDNRILHHANDIVDTVRIERGRGTSVPLPLGSYRIESDAMWQTYSAHISKENHSVQVIDEYPYSEISLISNRQSIMSASHTDGTITQQEKAEPCQGILFGLYSAQAKNDIPKNTLIATGRTGPAGELLMKGQFPPGSYYWRALETPESCVANERRYPINLARKGSEHIRIVQEAKAEVVFNASESFVTLTASNITGETPVAGVLFEIKDINGYVVYRNYTNKEGTADNIKLPVGQYMVRQVLVPEGYAINAEPRMLTVNGDSAINKRFLNDQTRVRLKVVSEMKSIPLENVRYGMFNEQGVMVAEAVSDPQGIIEFVGFNYGYYSIRQVSPLKGYIKNPTTIQLTVDGAYENSEKQAATIICKPIAVKLYVFDEQNLPLKNIEYALCEKDSGLELFSVKSDAQGCLLFSGMDEGHYIIREKNTPKGRLANRKGYELTINEKWSNPEKPLDIVTSRMATAAFQFVSKGGMAIDGMQCYLKNRKTGEQSMWTRTDKNGMAKFRGVPYGTFDVAAIYEDKEVPVTLITVGENYVNPTMPSIIILEKGS